MTEVIRIPSKYYSSLRIITLDIRWIPLHTINTNYYKTTQEYIKSIYDFPIEIILSHPTYFQINNDIKLIRHNVTIERGPYDEVFYLETKRKITKQEACDIIESFILEHT